MKRFLMMTMLVVALSAPAFAGEYLYQDLVRDVEMRSLQEVYPADIFEMDIITGGTGTIKVFEIYLGEFTGEFTREGFELATLYSGNRATTITSGTTEFFVFFDQPPTGRSDVFKMLGVRPETSDVSSQKYVLYCGDMDQDPSAEALFVDTEFVSAGMMKDTIRFSLEPVE